MSIEGVKSMSLHQVEYTPTECGETMKGMRVPYD